MGRAWTLIATAAGYMVPSVAAQDEVTRALTATSTPTGATPFDETAVLERADGVRVGGMARDV